MYDNFDSWTSLLAFGMLFLFFVLLILYYYSQFSVLKAIHPENRYISPSYVFLQLIPLFGSIYAFSVNAKIADSIRLEAENRDAFKSENDLLGDVNALSKSSLFVNEYRPTYDIGRTKCILGVCRFIPIVGSLAALGWLVVLIIYWIKLVKVKKMIQTL